MTQSTLGNRTELDKFLAYAVTNAHRFAYMEYFDPFGHPVLRSSDASVEVGTVDRSALMRAYVMQHQEEPHDSLS